MSVKRLSILLFAGTLASGCSLLNQPGNSWVNPTNWFTETDSGEQETNPLETDQVTVATGDEDLKQSVESGEDDDAAVHGALDEAIAPELRDTARDAREKLDNPGQQIVKTAPQQTDLWSRLREGFALDHNVDNERVRDQLNWYASHPGYINRVVDRGSRYLHYILDETEKRGLPAEFALLPVVESAFDPFAYSHGRAAGLWQFIPSTGKYFGLTQSWWHDDRRDVVAATDAALTYLDRLANRFDGDYTLALAAYNSGGGTVSSAMRRNRKKNRPQDFWSLELPRETRHYVPKLIALAKIFDKPEDYGITLPALEDEPYFEIVETGSQLDLAQAAELASIDVDEIYLLNPTYNRWATNPDGPHRLLVPRENAETFRAALAKIPAGERVSWRNYKVQSGDSLITIARKFATTPSVIQQVNNLNSDLIRIGQRLMIPSASKASDTYALSASQRLERKQDRKRDGNKVRYTVRRGDTFWDIAREHRVSVREVAAWNGMAPGDPLIPGKRLVIWSKTSKPTVVATNNARGNAMVRKVGYRVRKGDSLSTIANRFAVNVRDIASWNDLNTSRYLQPGQSLVLYVDIRNSP
ncbi:LysM peptidoglycan-binding domain-containing protein [Marinobacter sp. M216]|uniref:LysM peptidoglycan-binding domain-containing protein n=1 Tax=Marinobacter albus TaxID=3030833 RepID=A0ABT7HD46_9GAMM|nr:MULTISPECIES: LysM peptidoglycan-binding domain-containing protein [unclassified Marinobacter]MBW7469960.1 LysM peptidoglycan-binding domain-containing protein [Marinobacter sp. F4218]MDK9557780.1 LysM peptidoglycan-binding domain-containing protein [Marinobacter sp. M216]